MATSYPGDVDSFPRPVGGDPQSSSGGKTHSEYHDDTQDGVEAIQQELGINPADSYKNVDERINLAEWVRTVNALGRFSEVAVYSATVAWGSGMTVNYSNVDYTTRGIRRQPADSNVVLSNGGAYGRFDVIWGDEDGVVQVTEGAVPAEFAGATPFAASFWPAVLAVVYVPAGITVGSGNGSITVNLMTDPRLDRPLAPVRGAMQDRKTDAAYDGDFDLTASASWKDVEFGIAGSGSVNARAGDVFIPNVVAGDPVSVRAHCMAVSSSDNDAPVYFTMAVIDDTGAYTNFVSGPQSTLGHHPWKTEAGETRSLNDELWYIPKASDIFYGGIRFRLVYINDRTTGTAYVEADNTGGAGGPALTSGNGPYRRRLATQLIWNGQSLNTTPAGDFGPGRPIPMWVMEDLRALGHIAISTTIAWGGTNVDERFNWDDTIREVCLGYQRNILVNWGGFADIDDGKTAAALYADQGAVAAAARTAGVDYVIQITHPTGWLWDQNPTDNAVRNSYNTLVKADASGYFDAVMDIETDAQFADPYDPVNEPPGGQGVFLDIIGHFTDFGAGEASDVFTPLLVPYML
jgi:hypothetical protein